MAKPSIIGRRYRELVQAGELLFEEIKNQSTVGSAHRPACIAWLFSAINLLEISSPANSRFRAEALALLPESDKQINRDSVATILGILKSAAAEWSHGLMKSLELKIVGFAFEQFLEHAASYNENNKKTEAAVLASAVLEDTVKRLCQKSGITEDKSLEPMINALKSKRIIGKVKADRLKSYATLRNQAFHAKWSEFDDRDLRQMIEGLQELIDTHFASD